jgi:integrase/recombinase XerD
LEAQIRSFLNYLRVEKGLSDNTMYAYQRDMMKFAEFAAKQNVTIGLVERAHVVDFLRSLYLKKLDSRSVARHLVTIRHFFRFCFAEGLIQEDPAANVQSPKFRQSLPEFLSLAEVDRLLAQPDANSRLGLRDKAMIELLYSTGLRVSEL